MSQSDRSKNLVHSTAFKNRAVPPLVPPLALRNIALLVLGSEVI